MPAASLSDFRSTLRLTWINQDGRGEKVFSYWNNQAVSPDACDREEVLHIVRRPDGSFYLEIANLVHSGTLEELEMILYQWAKDEGWLE